MRRRELEQTLRAAGPVAREVEFFLIGSQALHARCRRVPAEVLLSQECDLYPKNHPERADLIDAELGRRSKFARRHADVVTPEIASLPVGWERRLKPWRVSGITAWCLGLLTDGGMPAKGIYDLRFTIFDAASGGSAVSDVVTNATVAVAWAGNATLLSSSPAPRPRLAPFESVAIAKHYTTFAT